MKKLTFAAVVGFAVAALTGCESRVPLCTAESYDLHKKSLVPITEKARPAGAPMAFVKDGKLNFVVVTRARTYGNELRELQRAFKECFGAEAPVANLEDSKCQVKPEDYKYQLLLGDQPKVQALGIDVQKLPKEGFVIKTFENGIVVAGLDYHLVKGWGSHPLDHLPRFFGTWPAVMDFTERFLGVRRYFITDLGKIYPKARNFTITPVWYEDAPYFLTRGNNYGFYYPTASAKGAKHYEQYMGEVKRGDTSMFGYWRLGGSRAGHGKHCPDPQGLGKLLTAEEREKVFFKDDAGKLWYNAGNHFGNYFEPIRLDGFAKMYMDAVKAYFDSDGKVNPWKLGWLQNNTYVNFGVCDSMALKRDYEKNPTVVELGLLGPAKDPWAQKEIDGRAAMRNVYGRMYQYMANRLKKDCPGKKLFVMNYYNSLWAPDDPRWMLPDNVESMVCDGCLVGYSLFNKKFQDRSRALFGGWVKAMGGRPVSMGYLYNCGQPYVRPFAQQYLGRVPKILDGLISRDGYFFDGGIDYHTFYAYYVGSLSQWNPDIDPVAVTEEAFELCCGAAAPYLKKFYRGMKAIVDVRMEADAEHFYITNEEIARFEALLDKARAAVDPQSDEGKRTALICDYWPPHFEHTKIVASYENPRYDVKSIADADVTLDGKADEAFWKDAVTMPMKNSHNWKDPICPAFVKLAWTKKGIYGYFESDEKPLQTPDKDLWCNDTLEFFVSQFDECAEFHQFVFDSLGRGQTLRRRDKPIPQPYDDQFKPKDFKFANVVTDNKWTAEFFVPFDCLWHPEPPKVGDTWRCTAVKTHLFDVKQLDGTAMTLGNNGRMEQYDIITFK